VEAAPIADAVEEGLVELKDGAFAGGDLFVDSHLAEGVDDGAGVDLVGAAGAAGFAADAEPDGGGAKEGVFLAELDHAQDLGGGEFHKGGGRTAGGAAQAVETALYILLAQRTHFFDKAQIRFHLSFPLILPAIQKSPKQPRTASLGSISQTNAPGRSTQSVDA